MTDDIKHALFMYSPRPDYEILKQCQKCYGTGWYPEVVAGTEDDYIPDYNERYCDCEAGKWCRIRDGAKLP
jgi:hypothetical protein